MCPVHDILKGVNVLIIFDRECKLLSCLLCNFFSFSIFPSPSPLRVLVLHVKPTVKTGSSIYRECSNELIIRNVSLNKYVLLEDRSALPFMGGKFQFRISRVDDHAVIAC
jgi:hypothetical protein